MNKIYMLMGKSASGKDTIKNLVINKLKENEWDKYNFSEAVMYTTRPIRNGEIDGVDYNFVSQEFLEEARIKDNIIEERNYNTIHGIWTYFTHVDSMNLNEHNYIYINTLEAYTNLIKYFDKDIVVPIYIWIDDGIRLQRALNREIKEKNPKYSELCRRFLADQDDFSEEKINSIYKLEKFENIDLDICANNVYEKIVKVLKK